MKSYGAIFFVSYFATFFVLVTLKNRFGANGTGEGTLPGDVFIPIGDKSIFFPFTSSLAAAAIITVMYQAYDFFKRF